MTNSAEFGNLLRFPSPNVNPPPLSQVCARISAELIALECEQRLARLADPHYRAFLVALYRLALTNDENESCVPLDQTRTLEQLSPFDDLDDEIREIAALNNLPFDIAAEYFFLMGDIVPHQAEGGRFIVYHRGKEVAHYFAGD